jgi:threonine aldolase
MDKVDTNIVIVDLDGVTNDKAALLDALKQKGVLGLSWNGNKIRFVTCRNISKQKAITAAAIIKDVLESFVRNR